MTRSRRRRALFGALVLLFACTCSGGVLADAHSLSESLTGDAKTAYEGGKLLYANHDYAGAATKFRTAYASSKDPRLLWNIAACEKELRHYARAAALVDRYLRDASSLATSDTLAQARATQTALRQFFSPVTIEVEPAGALVLVDGEEVGRAPLERPVPVDLGVHLVRVEKEGFTSVEQRLDVPGQSPMSLKITLTAIEKSGVLAVSSSGPHDAVSVDGRVVGAGSWESSLPAGTHRVKVTAPGKKTYDVEVLIGAGERRTVEVTLQDEGKAPLWPWIVGGAAVVVGGTIAGYLLLKPSDTQGPAPSGALGTVYLSWAR